MNLKKILYIIVPLIVCFSLPVFATQSIEKTSVEPMEKLSGTFAKGIEIITDDSNASADNNGTARQHLWNIINEIFDFNRISMLAVGPGWKKFNTKEKENFIESFTKFLGNTYLDKIEEAYDNDKIQYLKQNIINKKKATVSTLVLRQNTQIRVDYSMININGNWKVYDVKVEGVSLVQNYRNQFANLLLNESPAKLIERIKKKNIK
ncbi:MAG: ABC transporter substrate-binding protein [Deltaproteobacteria bacterium]|nr:ABC transporter substrate-binding protein [Deltaproteobacteria bacterium]